MTWGVELKDLPLTPEECQAMRGFIRGLFFIHRRDLVDYRLESMLEIRIDQYLARLLGVSPGHVWRTRVRIRSGSNDTDIQFKYLPTKDKDG